MTRIKILKSVHAISVAIVATFAVSIAFADPVEPAMVRQALMIENPQRVALMSVSQIGERTVAAGERGVIALSDDAGESWYQATVPTSVTWTDLQFVDEKNGWVVGHSGMVMASNDGGQTWSKQLDGIQAAELMLADAQESGDELAIRNAEWLVEDGPDKPFFDVHFTDSQNGMAVGAYNLAFETKNGGQSWTPFASRLDNSMSLHLYAVRSRGNERLIVGEQGLVLYSTDNGESFEALTPPYEGSFFTGELPPNGDIVVAGLRGNAFHSQDDGTSWSDIRIPVPASIFSSTVGDQGHVWLANQAGQVMTVQNDQTAVVKSKLPGFNDFLLLDDESILGASMNGVVSVSLSDVGVAK